MLVAAAREVGGVQIQNRGTIGGNVANASPAGDTLPVLAAADAVVVLQSAGGTRRVPFTGFYTGYRQTVAPARRADRGVRDSGRSRDGSGSGKSARARRRRSRKSCMAGVVRRPARRHRAWQRRADRGPARREPKPRSRAGASIDEAQRTLVDEIAPIDDIRSTAEYRRRVAANLLARCLRGTATSRVTVE